MFLTKLDVHNQLDAMMRMYVARSRELTATANNQIQCSRRKCNDPNCIFIPNYPKVYFDFSTGQPLPPWYTIDRIEELLD
jgi:hypothetical protein